MTISCSSHSSSSWWKGVFLWHFTISVLILRHHVRWCHGKTILSFQRGLTVFNLCAGFSSWLHGWMLVTSGCHFSHWKSAGQLVTASQGSIWEASAPIQVVPTKTAAPGNVTFVLLRVTLACAWQQAVPTAGYIFTSIFSVWAPGFCI